MAKNVFNTVQVAKSPQNWFDLGHDVKMTLEMGKLIPFLCQEVLPGDYWKLSSQTLIRFAPLVAPVMHSINVSMHYFFVPNRLVWDQWEDFISPPKVDSLPPAHPYFDLTSAAFYAKGTLTDYFGMPTGKPLTGVNALPFFAYQKIYNEYYRDQNLMDEVTDKAVSGGNVVGTAYSVRTRSWMHDYFTASLPFAQKGAPVSLPIVAANDVPVVRAAPGAPAAVWSNTSPSTTNTQVNGRASGGAYIQNYLYAQTSAINFSATTINDLRTAIKTQEFLERQARGGSRYIEQIKMQFGVTSSDARLQRPEFIGGTKNPVIISEVLQTSSSDGTTPQATMAGHGISANSGKVMSYYAEEHGFIIGIMSVTPNTAYQQGLPKQFFRKDIYDYAFPIFGNIGEQAVLNKEVYYDNADGLNNGTFGYVPRYSEYRYIPSRVAGEFRDTLAFWHLGRIFSNRPSLNSDFIRCAPRNDIFAVTQANNQNLWCHVYNSVKARRKLPKYGTPML
nr:MAG: major capsid protein [Microvirus sp.]